MERKFVVCDLETTGLDPAHDRIIEVGLVRLEEGEVTGTFHTLVNPGQILPLKVKRLTGLEDRDLVHAPGFLQVLPEIEDYIGDTAIVGHNVTFDIGFLEAARGLPIHNPTFDTLELARLAAPGAPSYRLSSLCGLFHIDVAASHRALDDALATARLLDLLIQKVRDLDPGILTRLNRLLGDARSGWHGFFSGLLLDRLKTFPDQKLSTTPYWRRKETKEEKDFLIRKEHDAGGPKTLLDEKELASLVGREGPLVAVLPGYEYRPQQEAMVNQIARAFNEEKYLLMEAGTGVGKSVAYLLPAILWGLANKERVLVSTQTINLQEQLWFKDVPLLAKVLKEPFRAALAKGRQNYLCLRRWFAALDSPHHPEEAAFFARVLVWLTITDTGDKSELNVAPAEGDFWLNICGEAEGCLGSGCRYQRDCFVNRARKTAEEADLIIANHSLLFSDVRTEHRVLPAYGPLIIDEAHHLEESATAHLGRQFSQGALNRWLVIAGKTLSRLAENAPPADGARWGLALRTAQETRLETAEAARQFFVATWEMATKNTTEGNSDYSRASLRLPCCGAGYADFLTSGETCAGLLRKFTEEIRSCVDFLELWAVTEEAWAGPGRDLSQIAQSGLELLNDLQFILENQDPGYVYWADLELSARGSGKHCSLQAAPIDVGTLLYNRFFKFKSTVILTSATLSVKETFDHFIERTGLYHIPQEKLLQAHFDSPFVYERQALLCINRDLPAQGAVAEKNYLETLAQTIFKLVEVTGGRTLVLFTSHRTLREVYKRLKPGLEALDICLLGHGLDGSRSRILEEFKNTEKTVLFGASSFWEGVDVPGEALSCVIMVKLPFMSPSVPVIEARLEALAHQERDGFRALSVPQAVIRFKQGFGRLIRSGSDRGCVVILDGRILSKSYGRYFLSSLPLKSHFRGGIDMVSKKLSDWLSREEKEQSPFC